MKNSIMVLLTFPLMMLISCNKDYESPLYSFENKNAKGLVNGTEWAFLAGSAEDSRIGVNELDFTLSSFSLTDPCDLQSYDIRKVYFTVPNKVGVYVLVFDANDQSNYIVTFQDKDIDGTSLFNIVVHGAIEILSTSDTKITGRIDARDDEQNFVNGSFTVNYCQ